MNYKGVKDRKFKCKSCLSIINWKGASNTHTFCSNVCQGNFIRAQWFETNKAAFYNGKLTSRRSIKKFIGLRDGNNCAICHQQPVHNTKPLIMVLDHIDGKATNCSPSNFRLVCPNCESQLPTFRGRNRGNGRKALGIIDSSM
jgi:hypothetical protein